MQFLHSSPHEILPSEKAGYIVDLGWSYDLSVNTELTKNIYLDTHFEFLIHNMVPAVKELGPEALIFKSRNKS